METILLGRDGIKLWFRHLEPGDEPITSVDEYLAARRRYDELSSRIDYVQMEMKKYWSVGKEVPQELSDEYDVLDRQDMPVMQEFFRRLPCVLVSRCPYCAREIWGAVGIFSLIDEFWYSIYSDGQEEAIEESHCEHLFCIDGALGLNGHQPAEVKKPNTMVLYDTLRMAAGVPFVKPRVLRLPTMVAVLHSFPVADKYTAYPVVYFAEQRPPQKEFCIGWARQEYVDRLEGGGGTFVGRRTDAQDYELEKWVEQGKLFWLDPTDDEHPLVHGPVEAFPYGNVPGRRNPYIIKDGKVRNLRNPTTDGRPKVRLER
jgi:hypothetical protein